ncbi:MAG: PrsW family glutamic-type intramembrane protease, partial [Candidatus Promineifilaceae bacterium]
QLGQVAALFLGLGGGSLALFHGLGSLRGEISRPFRLPPLHFFAIAFALVVGLGNVLLYFDVVVNYLFPFLFLLGAALPSLAVLAWASQRLGWPITWRQASLSFVSGATLSIVVTLILGLILASVFFLLVMPVELLAGSVEGLMDLFGSGFLERFFFSPYVIVLLFITALQAPIPEEFAKALGPGFMLNRISNERQAFMLGLASGAGFAILENMLYEGVYALWSDWTWGGVTLLRAIGAVLHPLTTGIVVVALFRNRRRQRGWFGRIAGAYLLAVVLHTLWNGGFEALLFMTGVDFYSGIGPAFNVYGESIAVFLVIYLVLFSAAMWWLLARIVRGLAGDVAQEIAPTIVSVRSVALWAAVSLLVILPIGAAIGPAWGGATDVFAAGPPPTAGPSLTATATPTMTPAPTSTPMPTLSVTTPMPTLSVTTLSGARIAFVAMSGGIPVIYVLEGESLRPLTESYGSASNPSWSADGSEIVFESNSIIAGNSEIYAINADGSNLRQLTDQLGRDSNPAWSPDGEHIVFESKRDGISELYLMNADGSEQERLTN